MHLAEGIISSPLVLGGGVALAGLGVALGLRNLDERHVLRTAVLGSGFFVASLVHIPLYGFSVHLSLGGLLGIVLGWAAFPAVLVALLLQMILFGIGGLTTLGLNTCIMAIPAVLAYGFSRRFRRSDRTYPLWLCATLGAGTVALSALLLAAILRSAGEDFSAMAWAILIAHIPVMLIEAGVTGAIIKFLSKVSPELLAGQELICDAASREDIVSCD